MATVSVGQETTYTGALIPIRHLEPHLYSTDKDDYPFLKMVGFNSYPMEIANVKIEWQDDELIPIEDTVGSGGIDASSTTLPVSNANRFGLGDILEIESEWMWVTAVDTTNNQLTVVRGYAGTTAATHAASTKIYILGNARPEGSSPGTAKVVHVSTKSNYTQIFDAVAEVSGTEANADYYGVADALDRQIDKRMRELYMKMERALLYGRAYQPSDNTQARTAGGLKYYITTNVTDLGGAALTESDIIDEMETIWGSVAASFVPNVVLGNSWAKRKFNSFYAGTSGVPRMMDRAERVGGIMVDRLETDFGTLDFVLDHLVKNDEVWLIRDEFIECGPFRNRGFAEYDASTPGTDHIKRRILGEYTFRVLNEKAMARIHNFSTTS